MDIEGACCEHEFVVFVSSALAHSVEFRFRLTSVTDIAGADEKRERLSNFLLPSDDIVCLLPAYGYVLSVAGSLVYPRWRRFAEIFRAGKLKLERDDWGMFNYRWVGAHVAPSIY